MTFKYYQQNNRFLRKSYDELIASQWISACRCEARCHQNEESIAEYTYELQKDINMIRTVPDRDKVLKF